MALHLPLREIWSDIEHRCCGDVGLEVCCFVIWGLREDVSHCIWLYLAPYLVETGVACHICKISFHLKMSIAVADGDDRL